MISYRNVQYMLNAIALSQKNAARKKKCIEVAVNERQQTNIKKT